MLLWAIKWVENRSLGVGVDRNAVVVGGKLVGVGVVRNTVVVEVPSR